MNTDVYNNLEKYYNQAIQFTKSHYENFPVISLFIKKDLRKHIAVIYQFARQADDLADEGDYSYETRLEFLDEYQISFEKSLKEDSESGFWTALSNTIRKYNLSSNNFINLISAFKQDISKNKYKDFDELLNYCSRSANPIGNLILQLHGINNSTAKSYSDKICTALQLTNFYQDISVDIKKNRIYIPQEELNLFEVLESDIYQNKYSEQFISLMKYQVERTKKLFGEGRKLLQYLPYRLKVQILVTIKGGETILKKIEMINYNVLNIRPAISKMEFLKLFINGLFLRG